ncbi:MAG: phage tail tape measure protein, partial [Acidobacteria bacterium]|nr:phage tail tape measure protein [Acidobacteriota bacterium]
MNIADIFGSVRLNLDTGEFEVQAAKATDKATATMGQRMKKAAGGLLGAGLGAGLGLALSGANKLDAATRQLQADTGMTADEAKLAQAALAGMYRGNLQGFDQISAAMAKVHNDLGLTGEAADEATAKFLKFGTATGQDAAAAVAAFDDILDAWNLTAADAGPLMDGLIADHQKFGGVIGDSQAALAAMAPAMQAANMSIDDGRALLNLFNASGIDAAKAPAALAKAVKLLKPGQSLNDLIAQIGAIEDPTLRAQEAMRVFGAKSGIGLAQAIQPGMTSLDDFGISMEDAAGKTDDAAKVIEDSFGNRVKLALKGAEGYLAEFGTNFGDLVMVAAMFGPKFTTAITTGVGMLAGMLGPKIVAAIAATAPGAAIADALLGPAVQGPVMKGAESLGRSGGKVMGTAMAIALPAALVLGVAMAAEAIKPELDKLGGQIREAVGLKALSADDMATSDWSWPFGPKNTPKVDIGPLKNILGGDSAKVAVTMAGRDIGQGWTTAVAEKITAAAPEAMRASRDLGSSVLSGFLGPLQFSADKVSAVFGTSLSGVIKAARATGADGMLAMAAGIKAARQAPLDAFDTLKEMLKNALTPMGEIARLHGIRTSKELARGLKSGDPAVRAQAIATAKETADRLGKLAEGGGKAGKAAMKELHLGMKSKLPEV